MNIGVNTFGLKYDLFRDFDGSLARVKEIGFTAIEICAMSAEAAKGFLEKIPEEQRKNMQETPLSRTFQPLPDAVLLTEKIRAHGFHVDTVHCSLPIDADDAGVLRYTEELADFYQKTGIRYVVTSPMVGLEKMKEIAPRLELAARTLQENGMFLLIHNHALECHSEEGTTALEYAMEHCPHLYAEPDAGWMVAGGMDPVPFMEKYGSRIIHLHLKDFKKGFDPEGEGEERFSAIGEGILPLRAVLEAKKHCAVTEQGFFIDQDASTGDFIEDLRTGYENVRKNLE